MVITGANKKGAVIIMDMGKYIAEANRRFRDIISYKNCRMIQHYDTRSL